MSEAKDHLVHVIATRIMNEISSDEKIDENSWNLSQSHAKLALEALCEHLNVSSDELLELANK
jgi:hypothetical protein